MHKKQLSLTSKKHEVKAADRISEQLTALGRPVYRRLQHSHYVALHGVCASVDQSVVVRYYERIVICGEIVHSYTYCQNLKRNSCIVQISNGMFFKVVTFLVIDSAKCYAIGHYFTVVPYRLCARTDPALKLDHIVAVSRSQHGALTAVAAVDIKAKCVFISLSHHPVDFICLQVNSLERCT